MPGLGFHGPIASLIAGLLLLYCASLPGPWFTNEEATELFPSWIIRVLVFTLSLVCFYSLVWDLAHHAWW